MPDFTEDIDYFTETDADVELTGKEPKFVQLGLLDLFSEEFRSMQVVDLVRAYIELRNQLSTDRHGWQRREQKIKEQMQLISMIMRDKGDDLGVDSFKTPAGTAFRKVTESFTVSDWRAVCDYVRRTDNYQVFQRRVSGQAVKEIREQDGDLPPGVGSFVEVEFAVRSPVASKSSKAKPESEQ